MLFDPTIPLVPTTLVRGSRYRATSSPRPTGIAKILVKFAEIGISGTKPEELPRLFPSDSMELGYCGGVKGLIIR